LRRQHGADVIATAEQGARRQHVIARRHPRRDRRKYRRHAGGGGDAILAALEQAELAHELVGVRIRVAAIDVARDLFREKRTRMLGVVESKARR
jgi:hypothetical protein